MAARLVLLATMLVSSMAFAPVTPALFLRSASSCRLQRAGPARAVGLVRMQEQVGTSPLFEKQPGAKWYHRLVSVDSWSAEGSNGRTFLQALEDSPTLASALIFLAKFLHFAGSHTFSFSCLGRWTVH